ncbi:basement membrane-specific heparan sulfate proteoglycan core protein isoform X7 [Xenopus tropicalis]|uniref:Basement membrane-specific heparan sulfate proteoglycan core protein n=1 Tax=Xenopus tropicalis TaxID=8364 RepID=A0A8J1K077_XENTR|nr:basement membrane-specific heparan sulfate proteoglycan core protein isoform X7 [Xenopus tropicalis]
MIWGRTVAPWVPLLLFVSLLLLPQGVASSRGLDEVYFPDGESDARTGQNAWRYGDLADDEDFAADEASGDDNGSTETGSGTEEPITATPPSFLSPTVYYRALVNFTQSIEYSPELDNVSSPEFIDLSEAVVDTLESEYHKIPGEQMVSVVYVKVIDGDTFVELDVGSEGYSNDAEIRQVLFSVIDSRSIASYITSAQGFQFRRLGSAQTLPSPVGKEPPVTPSLRPCRDDEFTCTSGDCVPAEYRCDHRHDCRDMSDELECEYEVVVTVPQEPRITTPGPNLGPVSTARPATTPPRPFTRPPVIATTPYKPFTHKPPPDLETRQCRRDEARCPNGQCIPRDYLCDGEKDCKDGSDEMHCGTPSPCEPNEFKCKNGRCALKLWRCDGDNDCGDGSDELNCPTKGPSDTCAPDQFVCVQARTCIPASYQCDDEADCPDRSDEVGCNPPQVITPPEESIMASRGDTVRFTCVAIGVPTPIITWRLNWGHIPTSSRVSMTSENGHGTLIIRDVKEADQGAYTCEAINAKGMVFGIPDGVLILKPHRGPCPEGSFYVENSARCIPCFCFGVTKVCQQTGRYRNQIRLRFDVPEDFKGVNFTVPSHVGIPPLSSNQLQIDTSVEEFQLVDLSRRFLSIDSFWTLPGQFLGNKVDSYGGSLSFKVRYGLTRGQSEPVRKPDVILVGNGRKLIYRVQTSTQPSIVNQRKIQFTEENWQHESGASVTREDLLMTLQNLEAIMIQTVYDNKMASVGISDIVMDTTSVEYTQLGPAVGVEECRCPGGYAGPSCEVCAAQFERVPGGPFLGTCSGCNCNGHASSCDPVSGYCLNCQHNTEGPQCNKCKAGFFGDPTRGVSDACRPCPCPHTDPRRRFSDTCFMDVDGQPTCDSCAPGYTGRRCERCAEGYDGRPMQPGGRCEPVGNVCDVKGALSTGDGSCVCKSHVEGNFCNECKSGTFYLSEKNPDGCLKCFCMGITRQCSSSFWNRDQVSSTYDSQDRVPFTISNAGSTRTLSESIRVTGQSELTFSNFLNVPQDVYFWVLPDRFKGDKVTSYGGELRYTITFEAPAGSQPLFGQPDVVLQGNGIFLEHSANTRTAPGFPITITVPFRERAWRRADGQDATREHLLMALADIDLLMIRASYAERMVETRISNIHMDVAVPYPTDRQRAVEVEHCVCPPGYSGPSCQDCDTGYTRSTSGLYLGTCERCQCGGHSSECDRETGECLNCQHNTEGTKCEKCKAGSYRDPNRGAAAECQPCPCQGTSAQYFGTCFLDRDGHPTCDSCPVGYAGRQCERCAPGYRGDPARGQPCTADGGSSCPCDLRGSVSDRCDSRRQCECKPNVEGASCGTCRPHHFYLSTENPDGCLPCFCMGVTQQCTSSTYHRELISTPFLPGNFQNFALVNRQRSSRITSGFTVEMSRHGPQLTHSSFDQLGQESYYWQLPEGYQGDKREMYFARMRRAHKNDTSLSEEELRKKVASGQMEEAPPTRARSRRQAKMDEKQKQIDSEIWNLLSGGSSSASLPKAPPPSAAHNKSQGTPIPPPSSYVGPPGARSEFPHPIREGPVAQSRAHPRSSPEPGPPGHNREHRASQEAPSGDSPPRSRAQDSTNLLFPQTTRPRGSEKFSLVYKGFSLLPEGVFYWQLPKAFLGDKVASYGGKLRYTLTYNAGIRGSALPDADVQITGNDITLVAYQHDLRPRESKSFEIVFRESSWKRPDGQPATREHLMMALADLDEILVRASYSTDMLSSSITGVSMETAGPSYTNLPQALEVEECRCPPGYQGLSCQDCAPGYTRTGGGLYLGHCEPCYCNGHSESCHPETGACSNCLHNTVGESCDQCAPGFYGDASAGTPEDCQPCACPLTNPDNQFSKTCEILGTSGYRCTACQPGYTGQYCERCAPGYTGNPNIPGQKCVPEDSRSKLIVRIHPQKATLSPGGEVTLRCHVSGNPPYYFYWTREDGRPIPPSAKAVGEGENLHFSRVQPTDSGVYICTCRSPESVNTSKAEIVVSAAPSKPITVTVEEQRVQTVRPGSDVTFICTAKSKSPAYTLVWTRQHNRKLPDRAMDFNGILTIRRVQPEDAGIYVCTGSNMYDMDEGNATLYVQDSSQTQMFYGPYETMEGHRPSGTATSPNAAAEPRQLTVQRGQTAEFRCTATGTPTPAVEWTGPNGGLSPRAVVQGGVLRFHSVEPSDEGQYTCRVHNSAGQHFARVDLRVHSGSLPEVQVSPERTEVREGDTVRLYCRAGGTPAATISWRKEGGSLPPQALSTFGFLHFRSSSWEAIKRRAQELQARTERTDISTLVIPSISAADGGTYLCVGTSSAGSAQARIEVIVIGAPIHGPTLRIEPSSDTVIEGQLVELNCVSANPYATVTWHRGGGRPLSPNHQAYGSKLRILQASTADSGEYICRVTNGAATQQASIIITITRSSGPQQPSGNVPALRIEPSSDTLVEGQTLELNCLFPSYPNAVVTWHRSGQPLSPNHQVSGPRLRILQASVADSGEYICRVTTGPVTQKASILVTITRASGPSIPLGNGPAVRIETSSGSVVEGQTLELNCVVAGQPDAVVTWHRAGRLLSPNHQVLGSRLRITQASVADSGEYICRTTTGTTTRQGSIMVTITHSTSSGHSSLITPTINIESAPDSVAEGQTVVLNCVIEGRPHQEVTWYRPDQPLAPNHQVSGSRLRITHASPRDSGEYICRIQSGAGVQMASIMVSIEGSSLNTGLGSPIRIESSSETVELGQTIELNCLAEGHPGAVVTWHRSGGLPLPSNHQVSGSRMRILQASPADSGIYICRVSSASGSQEASVTINVHSSAQVPNQFPYPILIEKSADTVSEGQTLDLNCVVVGQPQAPVSWHRPGASFSSNHQISGSRLRIVQASTADSGQYVCRHDTGAGIQQASISVSILSGAASSYRLQSPVISIDPHSATVQRGQNATFKCRIHDGAQPIRVTWQMRHNQPMEDNVHISPNGSIITIVGATHKNQGSYRCMASNAYGMVHSSVNLVVQGRPSVSVIPHGKIRVKEGEPINVECMGIGDPRPIVSWRRTGARENLKQHRLAPLDGTAVLQIPSAKPADSGSYTCVAHNPHGSTQVHVEVHVEGHVISPGAPLVLADKPVHVVVTGGQATLSCSASGNPTPTITWSKLRAPLPWQHQVVNNTLIIPNVAQQDSGQYICNASNADGHAEVYVTLDVETPAYATTLPHEASVSPGEPIQIQCLAHGTPPIKFQWSRVDGTLPGQASIQDGVLHIDQASASDSGTYRCVASNKVGSSEAFAQVTVSGGGAETGRPTASIIPRGPVRVKVGSPIYLECMGQGDPRPVVSWRRTGDRQNLKPQQLVPLDSHAVLQILSARPEDSGSYTCTAQNPSGSTQVQVEVHVEGRVITPGVPKVTAEQPLHVVVAGDRASLSCTAVGNPAPKITWSKLRAPLPWQHEIVNDTLIIPKAALQDSGQYICNASNAEGYSEVFVTLDVETPPYATTLPDEVSVSVGEVIQIQCLAHGTSPLKFQWSKVNGSLPDRATVRDSTLHINLAKAADAGTYRCVVGNKVGSSEAFAQVSVLAPFAVRVSPLIDTKAVSGTAEFTCTVVGDPRARIQWSKEGGQLPAGHQVQGGVLRIPNLESGNEGTYTCRVSSRFGQAQESVRLVLQALPKVRINIRTSVQTVLAGNSVEFECLALGDPRAKVTWSKVGSRLPGDAVISGGTLRIEQVKQSDAGQYRCTAANDVGEVQSHVILHVQSVPQIAAQPEMKEITAGSTAVFPCLASGFPVPDITWSKLEGDLPSDHQIDNNVLTILSVKPEDAGTYVCTAANRQGRVTAFSMLKVRERVVPYFTGQPQSYLSLPSIKDAHKKLEIKITFRPDTADALILYSGMLVYSGQKKSNGADFVSFGLVGGRPEFRFDAGSGMATIRYPTAISLGEFHTVTLYRNLTQGSLVVDRHVPVNGTSQGKFQGLDLNEELFLGGYSHYDSISKTGLNSGFVGCVRQLIIQGEEVIFKDLDLSANGVSNCPTCRDRPCKNRGTCQDSESSSYVCVCSAGFTGSNCEHSQALHCHPEACGPDATCINRADGQGYTCRCHLGKSGEKCMDGTMVNTPSFNGDSSYISYPSLTNIHNELRVDLEFKPISPDGLLFFSGGKAAPVEDFVSIAMVGGYLEFRYELGSGLAILRSLEPVTLGQWHKVSAERVNKDGTLIVDGTDPVKRSAPGKSQGLNLKTLMYLGGVDGSVELPSAANISRHFQGCIGEVSINGKKVDISYSFTESSAIGQCYDNSPCDRMPCLHGGRCQPTGEYEYQCLCLDGFKGDRCETHEDQCQIHNPCLNGATCKDNRCHCPSGYSGTICEHGRTAGAEDRDWPVEGSGGNDAPGLYGSFFSDDSYIALPKHVFPRSRPEAPETIELEIRTSSSEGVILWQGMVSHSSENHLLGTNQEENEQSKGKDFISLGLKDGHLVFSYQLGSGEANIRSEDPVNDGEWHRIVAVREGKLGSIQIDGEDSVSGASPGRNIMVNTKGSVYLGGAPNVKTLTGGKFSSGINGCIKNLVILNARPSQQPHQPIDLKHHAEAGHNTKECPS